VGYSEVVEQSQIDIVSKTEELHSFEYLSHSHPFELLPLMALTSSTHEDLPLQDF
jgi:hypothetical protein